MLKVSFDQVLVWAAVGMIQWIAVATLSE